LAAAFEAGTPATGIRIVDSGVVVDVDFAARNDVHTGIQRVVRSVMPEWSRERELIPAAWTNTYSSLRTLDAAESTRVLQWGGRGSGSGRLVEDDTTLVIPWRSVVVVAEVPIREVCPRLAAMAESSGNRVVAIGYDCIPLVSADMVPLVEPERFVHYLTAVKHMRRVAGISASATVEFRGFADMLSSQGLPGPTVFECGLPAPGLSEAPVESERRPMILCVGSFEPRKNQEGVLYAAQVLWREGLEFELCFVGGGGLGLGFPATVRRVARTGRPVSIATAVSDAELEAMYRAARFSVFASLHEGYGLPVVESLAHGVPVITTNYGSTREIGLAGGTVLIDPRDDRALVDAMRELLVDPGALAALRHQIGQRTSRTWADYADELWAQLVVPELVGAR
jgi:glycosyltransferase involved in cell wall biosynthesis